MVSTYGLENHMEQRRLEADARLARRQLLRAAAARRHATPRRVATIIFSALLGGKVL